MNSRRASTPLSDNYKTMSSLVYDYKGNPAKIRAVLDKEKRNDLRQEHFTIGGPSANVI
jgi:hypothetical protein